MLNNGVHDSVGGHKTIARSVSLEALARAAGYDKAVTVRRPEQVPDILAAAGDGNLFIEILCRPGHRPDLPRPLLTPRENKEQVMRHLREPHLTSSAT
ncbi:hypothetical protein D3C72_2207550 [compost metagenome]